MTRDPLDRAAQMAALVVLAALAVVLCVWPSWPVAVAFVLAAALVGLLRALARRDLGAEVDAVRALAEDAKKHAVRALEAAQAQRAKIPGY